MKALVNSLFLICALYANSQTYIPIPESDAVWIQASFLYFMNGHEHTTITQPLSFGADTVVSGTTYKKLQGHQLVEWVDNWRNQQTFATGSYTLHNARFLFRQDVESKKVYTNWDNQDTLLYDFDLTVGQIYPQTVNNLNYPNLLVMGVDSVQLLDGLYHKKWILGTNASDSGYVSIIEGVGSTLGFSLPIWPLFEQTGAILCLKESGDQIYENWGNQGVVQAEYSELCEANVNVETIEKEKSQLTIFPNPSNGTFNIWTETDKPFELSILDLFGREIYSKPNFLDGQEITLNVRTGTYIVILKSENKSYQKKITIE